MDIEKIKKEIKSDALKEVVGEIGDAHVMQKPDSQASSMSSNISA